MQCTMGTSKAKLTVLPDRVTDLTGKPQANISDHKSFVNLAPFGRCRSMGFPATASATAAAQGTLTPMPCMHNTPFPWMGGKMDYIIKGQPALLKSCKCQCMWGGTISLVTDGQRDNGLADLSKKPHDNFETEQNLRKLYSEKQETMDFEELIPKAFEGLAKVFEGIIDLLNNNKTPYTEAEKHYKELLKKTQCPKDIPSSWKEAYEKALDNIANESNSSIESMYSDIELLYNIHKLATSKEAKDLDLENLSYKMPYQVFDIAKKVPGFLEKMPSKQFWDSLDKFIPLYTNMDEGAYFDPHFECVVISMSDKDIINRLRGSDWFKSGLLHHEFGHAQDSLRKWSSNQEFIDVFNEFQQEIIDDNVETKLNELIAKYQDENKYTDDVEEQLGGLSDCIQAALQAKVPPEKRWVGPRGHPGTKRDGVYTFDYFDKESLRMAEFIAHSSENYWSGNDLFKSLCPKTYEKTRKTIEQLLTSK